MDISLRSALPSTEDAEIAIRGAMGWVSRLNTGELMQRILVETLLKGLTDRNAIFFSCAVCQNAESGIDSFVLHYHTCVHEVAEAHRQTIMTCLEDYVVAYDVFHALVLDHIKIGCGDGFLLMYQKMLRKATQTYYADFNAPILAHFVQIARHLKMLRRRNKLFVDLCKIFPGKRPKGRPLGSKNSCKKVGAELDGNALPEPTPDTKKGRKSNLRSLENMPRRQSCDSSVMDGAASVIPKTDALKQESEEKPSEVSTSDSESVPDGEYKVETILASRRKKDHKTGRMEVLHLGADYELDQLHRNRRDIRKELSTSDADRTAEMDEIEKAVSHIIEREVKRDFLDELVRITLDQNVSNVLDLTGIDSFAPSNHGVMEEHKMEVVLERKTGKSVSNAEEQQNLVDILAGWDYLSEIQPSSAQNDAVQLERVEVEREQSSSCFQLSDVTASAYDPGLNFGMVSVESEENRVNLNSSETVDSGAELLPKSPGKGEEIPNLQKLGGESMGAECCCKEEAEEMDELQKCKEYEEGDSKSIQARDSADKVNEEDQDLSPVMPELQEYGEEKTRNALSWLTLVLNPKESVRARESTEVNEDWDPEAYKSPPYSMTYIVKPYDEGAFPVHGVFPGPGRNGYHKYVSSVVMKEMLDYNRRHSIPLPRNGAASLEDSGKEGNNEEMNEGRLEIEIQLMELSDSRNLLLGCDGQQEVGKIADIRGEDQEEVMCDVEEAGKDQSAEMLCSEANQEARAIKYENESDSSMRNEVGESALEKGIRTKEEISSFAVKQEELGDSELKAMEDFSDVNPMIKGQKIKVEPCDSKYIGSEVHKGNEEIGDSRLKNEVLQSEVEVEEEEIKDARLPMDEIVDIAWGVEDGDRLPATWDFAPWKGAPVAEVDDSSSEEILVVVRVNNQSLVTSKSRSEYSHDPRKAMETKTGSNQIEIQKEDMYVDPSESEAEEIYVSVGIEDRQVEVADSRQGSHKVKLVPEMSGTIVSTVHNKDALPSDPAEEITHCSNIETVEALQSLTKDPKKLAKVSFSASFMETILTPLSYSTGVSSGRRGIAARPLSESMEPFEESIPNCENSSQAKPDCSQVLELRNPNTPKKAPKRSKFAVINPSIPKPVLTSSKGKSSISKAKKPNSTPLSVKNSKKSNESLRKTHKKPQRVSIDITANSCSPVVRIEDYQQKRRLTMSLIKPILKKSAVSAEKITARKTEPPKPSSHFSQPLQTAISHITLSKDIIITPIGKKRLAPAGRERSSSLDGVDMGQNVSLNGVEYERKLAPSRKKRRNSMGNNESLPNPKLFINAPINEEIERPMSPPIATRLRKRVPV